MTIRWVEADWPAPQNIRAGSTMRRGGVSQDSYASLNLAMHVQDEPAAVIENRRRFVLGCRLPAEPHWLHQIHSVNVASGAPPCPDAGTDAIVTREANEVCAVLTADCLPVVFSAADGSEVGVAHAGWRGLCNGILEATVAGMQTFPADIIVWFGPAISAPSFEVGGDVRDRFVGQAADTAGHFVENARGRFQADLYGLARQRLAEIGVSAVYGGDHCTFDESDAFFSYRRDGGCGRMATFIYRTESA